MNDFDMYFLYPVSVSCVGDIYFYIGNGAKCAAVSPREPYYRHALFFGRFGCFHNVF